MFFDYRDNLIVKILGNMEVFLGSTFSIIFGLIIYNVINLFFFKNLLKRFGLVKKSKKDFYECGFRPQKQKPVQISIQFFMITIFFLLYDIELLFLFPFLSGLSYAGLFDFFIFFIFIFLFVISLVIDYLKHVLY